MRMMASTTTSYFPLHLKTNLLVFPSNNVNNHNMNNNCCYATGRSYYSITGSARQIKRKWVLRATSSNQGVVETSLTSLDSASTVVRKFYQGINGHDLGSVENLIAESCVYEDLIFPQPFVGRKKSRVIDVCSDLGPHTQPVRVSLGPVTHQRAKQFKESLQALVRNVQDQHGVHRAIEGLEGDNEVVYTLLQVHEESSGPSSERIA